MQTDGQEKMLTSNEALKQLNEKLGITDRDSLFSAYEVKSVEEMLENSRKEFEEFSRSIAEKKQHVEEATEELDSAIKADGNPLTSTPDTKKNAITAITTFKESLDAMTSLINTGEDIMLKLVDAIKSTDLIDPDVVSSTANIIEGIRIGIADIISYNTEKMKLEHQYRLAIDSEMLKQKHRLELEYFKSELRLKEAQRKSELKQAEEKLKAFEVPQDDGANADGAAWSQIDVVDAIRKSTAGTENVEPSTK